MIPEQIENARFKKGTGEKKKKKAMFAPETNHNME